MAVINIEKEMPESCGMCDHRTVCTVFGAGWANANNRYSLGAYSRQDDCPLKSVNGLIEKIEQMDFDFSDYFGDYYDHTNEIIDKVVGAIKEYCGGEE